MVARANPSVRLIGMGTALAATLVLLTREVTTQNSAVITADVWFEHLLLAARTVPLLEIFGAVTLLGDAVVIIGIAGLAAVAILFYKLDRAYLAGLAVTLIGAAGSGYAMKTLVARPRPGGLLPSTVETSYSFPSGHAIAALALYGFLAYILCRLYPTHAKKIIVAAALIILFVGASRLYLGVHFPSDIVAGYLLGGLWLLFGIALTGRLLSGAEEGI